MLDVFFTLSVQGFEEARGLHATFLLCSHLSHQQNWREVSQGESVNVCFEGPLVSRRVTPRELLSEFIGCMVCVEGIVTTCTLF